MTAFDYPSNTQVVTENRMVTTPWNQVFSRWQSLIQSIPQSGTTALRPTTGLWIGRQYFDSTLGRPVYVKSIRPTVWVDGAGTVV